jgi:hypothetical protein
MKFSFGFMFILAANMAFASSRPVSVANYVENKKVVVEAQEADADEIHEYLEQLNLLNDDDSSIENARINYNPAKSAGKIFIRVQRSNTAKSPETLEVFRQNSTDPHDLTPLNIFDNNASNRALVSTATGNFKCRGGAPCSTPIGFFNFDTFELMHHSSRFNNSPMPHSMFFMASVGIAIHGIPKSEWKDLGRQASHGCIRIHPTNATILFDLLQKEGGRKSGAILNINN